MRRECCERFARHRLQRKQLVGDPSMHHGTCVIGIINPRWQGKRSRHSRRMHNPQFYVSGKRPMVGKTGSWQARLLLNALALFEGFLSKNQSRVRVSVSLPGFTSITCKHVRAATYCCQSDWSMFVCGKCIPLFAAVRLQWVIQWAWSCQTYGSVGCYWVNYENHSRGICTWKEPHGQPHGGLSPSVCLSVFLVNTLMLRKNDRHFAHDIFKCIFLNENMNLY